MKHPLIFEHYSALLIFYDRYVFTRPNMRELGNRIYGVTKVRPHKAQQKLKFSDCSIFIEQQYFLFFLFRFSLSANSIIYLLYWIVFRFPTNSWERFYTDFTPFHLLVSCRLYFFAAAVTILFALRTHILLCRGK